MSGITALVNPITALKCGKTKVSIYSDVGTGMLAFEQRLLGEATSKIKGGQGTAILLNPSNLVSMVLDDTVQVYGVNSSKKLSLLSPGYQAFELEIKNGIFAGCSNGESDGWFFYQDGDVKLGNATDIFEVPALSENARPKKVEGLIKPLLDTKLAVCYDGEHRWLAYQDTNNCIVLRNVDTDKYAIIENTRWTAQTKTPIGITFVPGHSTRGHIFVYYLHKDFSLRRAFIEIDETFDFRGYGEEVAVDKAGSIADWTQLAVVADTASKTNYVYAARNPATKQVSTVIDNWGSSITRLQEYYYSQIKHNHLIGNEKDGRHTGPGHVHHGNFPSYTFPNGSEGSHYHGGSRSSERFHEKVGPPPYPHSHHGSHMDFTHGRSFHDMSDLEVELGKVNMNALLKLCFGEPRVEYNRHYYHPAPAHGQQQYH
ncbi:hypothetical protein TWF730_010038 [Orbilia blumenaviensis]|uniref:Uncharacterized protein n=1 Tax=Orbilia blumenaviensis TaxID=1796055 RepID=A0AAV9UUY1_9PEZI